MNKTLTEKQFRKLIKANFSGADLELLIKATDLAVKSHKGQKRKSGQPFINHPLSVAGILIEWNMDLSSVISGILHDTVEDTDLTLEEIEKQFGKTIAIIVDGLTKVSKARSGMNDLSTYLPETTDNLSKLLIASSTDIRVIIIKLADRFHNLTELQYLSRQKQIKIARESLEVFAPIADRIGMGRVRMNIEELSFKYLDPERYNQLNKLMKKKLGRSTRKLGQVRVEVEQKLAETNLDFEVKGRVKSIYSLHKKMLKKDNNIDRIYDLMALRVIVNKPEECYQVLGIIHSIYKPMVARIKDYIAVPKANGYQSIHTTVITPNKQIAEFQIRTKAMHQYAEEGLAASFHYHAQKSSKNYKKGISTQAPKDLQWVNQLQDLTNKLSEGQEIDHTQLEVDLFNNQIFVYSPKGDIYNLPENSLPLDFAYLIHSKVGKHASGFLVNSKMHPFNKPLKNGDLVEVLTSKNAKPKQDWLNLVITSHAKSKIKNQLRKL